MAPITQAKVRENEARADPRQTHRTRAVTPRTLNIAAEPRTLVQAILDETGQSLLAGEFGVFAPHFELPYRVAGFEAETVAQNMAELRVLFDRAHLQYRRLGLSDLVRTCQMAEVSERSRMTCLYSSRLVAPGNVLQQPSYDCMAELVMRDGRWRFTSSTYAIDVNEAQGRVLLSPPVEHQTATS